jgi:ATP-dependent DNA helicase MPH1
MSEDDYFVDDLDDAILQQLDAIEAAHFSSSKAPEVSRNSSFDSSFDIDASELAQIDSIEDAHEAKSRSATATSQHSRGGLVQTTLFGDVLPASRGEGSKSSGARGQMRRTNSSTKDAAQTTGKKLWDHTEFAKSGLKRKTSKPKGKPTGDDGEEHKEEEPDEFVQFPAPFVPGVYCLICMR